MTIKFKSFTDGRIMEGELVNTVELNKIARLNCKGLTYLMNVMDDETGYVYMWFKDDDMDKNYFLRLEY